MARSRRGRKTKVVYTKRKERNDLKSFVEKNKRNLLVGTVAFLAVALIGGTYLISKRQAPQPQMASTITEPTPAIPTPSPKSIVKKLPSTTRQEFSYTVKKGDNLAKIGNVFCGNKSAWIQIAEDNNLTPPYTIQPKGILTISCPH